MKRIFLLIPALLLMTSCATTIKTATARTEYSPSTIYNATVADLKVAPERISHTLIPTKDIYIAGEENCKQATINEALKLNGNADLLVDPEFIVLKKGSKVKSVTVSGRPASYVNFRSLPDSVWSNPVFRMSSKRIHGNKVFFPTAPKKYKRTSSIRYQGEFNAAYRTPYGFMAETVHGIRHKYFFAGLGLGLHYLGEAGKGEWERTYDDALTLPFFLNLKGYLPVNNNFAPYLNLSLGCGFSLENYDDPGLYCDFGVGFEYRMLNVGLGWMHQGEVVWGNSYYEYGYYHNDYKWEPFDAFYIKVGICW